MANKKLFNNENTKIKVADTTNKAGGLAYATGAEHSLAQCVCTSMLGGTYYSSASEDLSEILKLAMEVRPEFLAKCAVYARKHGHMKDTPALLLAVLSVRDPVLLRRAFPQVADNGKMIRNFVQIIRSGVVGRKSLGSAPKQLIKQWLENSSNNYLFTQTVGNSPSLVDVIKLTHPKPQDKETENFFKYLVTGEYSGKNKYPSLVKEFEKFKKTKTGRVIPKVPFQMLTALDLTPEEWKTLALQGTWQFVRMNLNNFEKRGLFAEASFTKAIADKLQNPDEIKKAKVFPYQLYQAYRNATGIPRAVERALESALEISVSNIPEFDTTVHVGVDTSGSMCSAVSGGFTNSPISCVDVAALIASAIYRNNEKAKVYQFDTVCHDITGSINHLDSILTNISKVKANGGGTNCASFMKKLNDTGASGDLVIMISDNESWAAGAGTYGRTAFQEAWKKYKARNKNALLVCIDLTPGRTSQATGKDVLLVGGFSDSVFDVISSFHESRGDNTFWVSEIERSVEL